jgi:MFS transporter, PHS family, inorganic phosphate transporter
VFFVASSGFLASSWSLFSTNFISTALYFIYPVCGRLGTNVSEVIDEMTLFGSVVGMLLMGHLADRQGRKALYGFELGILIIATMGVVQSGEGFMVQNTDGSYEHSMDIYSWISWWRFFLGVGIGSEYPLSAVITAEWASTESRGTMLAAVFSMQAVAKLLAFAIGLGALRDTSAQQGLLPDDRQSNKAKLVVDEVWRWVIGSAAIPAAIAIVLRFTIPETPRYYTDIMKDLRRAVKKILKVYGRTRKVKETNSVQSALARKNINQEDHWYGGAWSYLRGNSKGNIRPGWRLFGISMLWGILDVAYYGLSMDNPNALSTLERDPAAHPSSPSMMRRSYNATSNCPEASSWIADAEIGTITIYQMLEKNSIRSMLVVSIAAICGSIAALLIINRF